MPGSLQVLPWLLPLPRLCEPPLPAQRDPYVPGDAVAGEGGGCGFSGSGGWMAENGEDKLIAVARHIAKTLGRTETMADDIYHIFSTFDGRFSMVVAGFGKECAHAYSICRRDFLEESISRLGLRLGTSEAVQGAPWSDVEEEIGRWTKAINVAVRVLFPSERRLCDRVFAGLAAAADLSFAEACRGPVMQLLAFPDAVAVGGRAPERLFRILDAYDALRDLIPEIDSV